VGSPRPFRTLAIRLPICSFDAKTGILCAKCESKLKSGEITEADVEASKALIHMAERFNELNRVTLRRSFESGGNYVLEFDPVDVPHLRSNPKLFQELDTAMKGKAWVVGSGGSDRKFLEDIFYPAKVVTVNTVWLTDGGKRTKVIVPARRSERYIGDFEKLRNMVKQARGIELLVETEREAMLRA